MNQIPVELTPEEVTTALELALAKEYDRGFSAGYNAGYNIGYSEGYDYATYEEYI